MERSAEQAQLATETNATVGVLPPLEQKAVRRRLVQSTLFPHKSPVEKNQQNCGEKKRKEAAADDGDDGEQCGSQGRKKRQPKRKTSSTPRETPIKKKQENSSDKIKEGVGDEDDDDEEYTGSQGRRKRKPTSKSTPRKKAACCRKVAFTGGMDNGDSPDDASPQKLRQTKKVLVRNGRINGTKGTFQEKMSNQPTASPPNLRLEAKMRAEENSRLFAGRQLHPFFAQRMGKKNSETNSAGNKIKDGDSNFALIGDSNFAPIHVFDSDKNDFGPIDWSNWTFHEDIFNSANLNLELESTTLVGNPSAGSLHLDDIHDVSNPAEVSAALKDASLVQSGNEELCGVASVSDEARGSLEPLDNRTRGSDISTISSSSTDIGCLCSDIKHQNIVLQERSLYHFSSDDQAEKSLWTTKYQPEKASEVCGNAESVKLINDWLRLWRDQALGNRNMLSDADKHFLQDNCHSDSDADDIDREAGLKNVLLVTGPVGCGKSAAVYACAKEQGFNVIEVNSSDWRHGALLKQKFEEAAVSHCIKQKFEEAVGPHCIKWTQESSVGSQRKLDLNSYPAEPANGKQAQDCKNFVTELISASNDEHDIGAPRKSICTEAKIDCDQGDVGTLIFFEDIDATLSEDQGFISAIQHLAGTGRRPMILTSNGNDPVLPESLSRDEVWFTMPSPVELFCHLNKVCSAEMVNIQSCIIEKCIQYCKGDMRKILLHLQFWSQGRGYELDQKACSVYGPLLFDLEVGHGLLPTLLPWGHSCQLSEHVEREITRCLSGLQDNNDLFEIFEEELANISLQNGLDVHNNGRNTIEARKEAILSQNALADEDNNLKALVKDACDSPNSSGSPVVFTRRSMRRLFDSIVSSGSEGDNEADEYPAVSDKIGQGTSNFTANGDVNFEVPFERTALDDSLKALNNHLIHSPEVRAPEALHPRSTTTNVSFVNEKCHSIDVSCVPESTFVPETLDNEIELPLGDDLAEVMSQFTVDNVDQATFRKATEPRQFVGDASVDVVNCQMIDFQSEHDCNEVGRSDYQVMDECSRIDLFKLPRRLRKCSSRPARDPVQETWNELRQTHPRERFDLDHEDASQCMELACSMSNLISETELLLHDCQMLLDDSPNQSSGPREETDYFRGLDRQVDMASTTAEHGYCFYVKAAAAIGSKMGLDNRLDIVSEMLHLKKDSQAVGKLLRQNRGSHQTASVERNDKTKLSIKDIFPEREGETCLDIVQSLVPPRSYLAVRGSGFHEYLSSLAQISRSETSRLSQSPNTTKRRRRARVAKNYLSSGALDLSPEEVSFLTRFSCYGNSAPKPNVEADTVLN